MRTYNTYNLPLPQVLKSRDDKLEDFLQKLETEKVTVLESHKSSQRVSFDE